MWVVQEAPLALVVEHALVTPDDLSKVGYYQTLRDYVRSKNPTAKVIGNPGTWTVSSVPEPSAWLLFAAGLAGLAVARRGRASALD